MALADDIRAVFPWAAEIGLLEWLDTQIKDGNDYTTIYENLRQTPQYRATFPGMMDPTTGQRRFATEAEYLNTVKDYRDILKTYGRYNPATDNPNDYVGFMEYGIDPNELQNRFQIYREIEVGSQDIRDAFYIFGGLDVTVDDLYRAVVDPGYGATVQQAYDQSVAGSTLDYATFIARSTERAISNAADQLQVWVDSGVITAGQRMQALSGLDGQAAAQLMGAIANVPAGPNGPATTMSYDQLQRSFEYALLSSAATEQGLAMPSVDRLEEFRSAGIDRQKALQAYGQYSGSKGLIKSMAARARVGAIGQSGFEEADLLNRGSAVNKLNRAYAEETALGQAGGGFNTQLSGSGKLEQKGRGR
jgi:hypothetical protein